MKAGLMLPPQADPAEVTGLAREAEAAGFDFVACGEHVFFHSPAPNAFVTLAAAAAVTERIRLLSALTLLPLYPPALAAKLAATLDRVSGGRLDLGVGVGGEYPAEFAAVGASVRERGRHADEALDVLTRLFAGEGVLFPEPGGPNSPADGAVSSVAPSPQYLRPLPVQRPRPPLWIGGRSHAAMRRAGRFGDVWMPYLYTPEQLAAGLHQVRAVAVEQGRSADALQGAYFCWTTASDDPAWARRCAVETLSSVYAQDFSRAVDRYVPTGTPAQVAARLADYSAAGAESVVLVPACPAQDLRRMIRLFSDELLPALRPVRQTA
jgi:alkanesulfonate monooxygenase SsuD/methylene tetrahydromethanopterin reductase-like flavin-dependent oxidoreductase (luciferase family)